MACTCASSRRTAILWQDIGVDPDWVMPIIDVSAEADPRVAAEAWMRDDMARVADLTRGPLFGYALFRAATDRFFCTRNTITSVMTASASH